jgi:hypothetical protein
MERYIHLRRRLLALFVLISILSQAQETRQLAVDKPQAIADLRTTEGAALVNARWYVQPAHLQEADFKSPGSIATDAMLLYPTGMSIKTNTLHPQVDAKDFEAGYKEMKSTSLEMREGTGLVSFVWFRTELTIPETIFKFYKK